MPRRVALLIAAALVLVQPIGAAQAQTPPVDDAPPAIAAIADLHAGLGPPPIVAVWREGSPTNRYHLVTSEETDLQDLVVELTILGWEPDPLRVTVTANEGGPSSEIATMEGSDATPSGTAATAVTTDGVAIDIPGRPTTGAGMQVRSVQKETAGTTQVALSPFDVNQLTGIPYGGLRTPMHSLTLGADGLPTTSAGPLPSGPAITRTGTGIRITVVDAPPTEIGAIPVTSVTDAVVVRTTDDLRAPRAVSLLVGANDITAVDGDGAQVIVGGDPWRAQLTTDPATGTSEVEVSLLDLAAMIDGTVDDRARIGVTRTVELEDGTRMLADGLDVRYRDLRAGRSDADEAATTDEDSSRQVAVLVAIGLLLMVVVLGPLVSFSLQARRERRHRLPR